MAFLCIACINRLYNQGNCKIAKESKTSQRRLGIVERQRKALELRLSGKTLDLIAKALRYKNPSGAAAAIEAALKRALEPAASEVRKLEIARLDKALLGIWEKVELGNYNAIHCFLRISERRAKLMGLDAPVKLNANITGDIEIKIIDPDEDMNDGAGATTDDNN